MFPGLPNLHPAIVHLPIVWVPLTLVCEALASRTDEATTHRLVAAAWVVGAISTGAAYVAGRWAADGLTALSPQAQLAIGDHAEWAFTTLVVVVAVACARVVAAVAPGATWSGWLRRIAVLLAIGAVASLWTTADHGGMLVFRHAVAVTTTPCADDDAPDQTIEPDRAAVLERVGDTFTWAPTAASLNQLGGTPWPTRGIALRVDGERTLTFDPSFNGVQVNAWMDLSQFEGDVALWHHRSDGRGGTFSVSTAGSARLTVETTDRTGRRQAAVLASGDASVQGRHALSAYAADGHLKGLVDGTTVVHGHTDALTPGKIAIVFSGAGVVGIEQVEIITLGDR